MRVTFKMFLEARKRPAVFNEHAINAEKLERFVIDQWGRLLYLNYPEIPPGADNSRPGSSHYYDLMDAVDDWDGWDEDQRDEEAEWTGEGCKMRGGTYLLSRKTVDAVLAKAQKPVERDMVMWRYGEHLGKLRPDSWLSVTVDPEAAYQGDRHEIRVPKGTPAIDTRGLADKDEWIMSTDVLLGLMKAAE